MDMTLKYIVIKKKKRKSLNQSYFLVCSEEDVLSHFYFGNIEVSFPFQCMLNKPKSYLRCRRVVFLEVMVFVFLDFSVAIPLCLFFPRFLSQLSCPYL